MAKAITVCLGAEYDDDLKDSLRDVLKEMGAELTTSWRALDLQHAVVRIDGEKLTVEAETFIGLTVKGPTDLVDEVRRRVAERTETGDQSALGRNQQPEAR